MKRFTGIVLIAAMIFSMFGLCFEAFAENNIGVEINGEKQHYDCSPIMKNDRVLVPMRGIFEALGAKVDWEEETETVFAEKADVKVEIAIGNKIAKINGKDIELDQSAVLLESRTLVPIRFVSEALGAKVEWNESSNTVEITYGDNSDTKSDILLPDDKIEEGYTKFYAEQTLDYLKNPYKGIALYGPFSNNSLLNSEVAKYAGVAYMRMSWADVEPVEGEYNWSIIDTNIEAAAAKGLKFATGFSTVVLNRATSYTQGTPLWLFEKGAKYTEELDGKLKVPVWNDPVFMEYYQRFANAFCERYNDDKRIAFVDIRSYGNWGEWNFVNLTNSKEVSVEEKIALTDIWKNCKIPLIMVYQTNKEIMEHTTSVLHAGARLDGVMNPQNVNHHKKLATMYPNAPAVGEWHAPAYNGYREGGMWESKMPFMPIFFERVISEAKLTYMGLGLWTSELFYSENTELVKKWANRIGYWYKMVEGSYPSNLTNGRIRITFKNDGVAPLYVRNDEKPCVKLALLSASKKVIDTVTIKDANPHTWLAGEYSYIDAEYDFANRKNAEYLAIGLFTDEKLNEPDILLGNKCDMAGKWHILNTIGGQENSNLAYNKVYTASKELPEYGYGIRQAWQAFDGIDTNYWGSDEKESYLEIDFGALKNFSKISLKELDNGGESFRVCIPDNDGWKEIASGILGGAGEKNISFDAVSASKLRVCFTAKDDMPVKISDLKVMK